MNEDDRCKDCIQNAPEAPPPEPAPVNRLSALRWELESSSEQAVVSEALALFHWAIGESRRGRFILAGDPDTGSLQRLKIPALERVFRRAGG